MLVIEILMVFLVGMGIGYLLRRAEGQSREKSLREIHNVTLNAKDSHIEALRDQITGLTLENDRLMRSLMLPPSSQEKKDL